MLEPDDILDVLAKCAAYQPVKFPRPSEGILAAWQEHFSEFPRITKELALRAVAEYYKTPGRPVPGPAEISSVACTLTHRDRLEWSDEDRAAYEAICDSKAADDDEALAIEAGEVPPVHERRAAFQRMLDEAALARDIQRKLKEATPVQFTEQQRADALASLERYMQNHPETVPQMAQDGSEPAVQG